MNNQVQEKISGNLPSLLARLQCLCIFSSASGTRSFRPGLATPLRSAGRWQRPTSPKAKQRALEARGGLLLAPVNHHPDLTRTTRRCPG